MEHYAPKVTLNHLIRPAVLECERLRDDITHLLNPGDGDHQYDAIYREVFFRDCYEYSPIELACEIDEADRHETADWDDPAHRAWRRHAPQHWNEHDRNVHGGRVRQHFEAQVAAGPGDTT